MLLRLFEWAHAFKARPVLAIPLALGNLVAVYYGWTDYYDYQFSITPVHLWPFVSDSPNAVLLFALVLVLYQIRARSGILDLFAFIANIKVGLWTVFVLFYYYDEFFTPEDRLLRWTLLALHVGMVGQAFVLYHDLHQARWRPVAVSAVFSVFVAHDVVDYAVGTHPLLPRPPDALVLTTTGLLTAFSLALAYGLFVRGRFKNPGRAVS